jgi:hypothetical protein
MPNFQPDICTFGDMTGYGAFDVGHAREHLQFIQIASSLTPPVLLPNANLLNLLTSGNARKAQLEAHNDAHTLLSQMAGITNIDFSQVDLDKQDDFYSWIGYHQTTHQQLRQFFGIV